MKPQGFKIENIHTVAAKHTHVCMTCNQYFKDGLTMFTDPLEHICTKCWYWKKDGVDHLIEYSSEHPLWRKFNEIHLQRLMLSDLALVAMYSKKSLEHIASLAKAEWERRRK